MRRLLSEKVPSNVTSTSTLASASLLTSASTTTPKIGNPRRSRVPPTTTITTLAAIRTATPTASSQASQESDDQDSEIPGKNLNKNTRHTSSISTNNKSNNIITTAENAKRTKQIIDSKNNRAKNKSNSILLQDKQKDSPSKFTTVSSCYSGSSFTTTATTVTATITTNILQQQTKLQQQQLLGKSDRMSKEKQKFFRFSAFNSERKSPNKSNLSINLNNNLKLNNNNVNDNNKNRPSLPSSINKSNISKSTFDFRNNSDSDNSCDKKELKYNDNKNINNKNKTITTKNNNKKEISDVTTLTTATTTITSSTTSSSSSTSSSCSSSDDDDDGSTTSGTTSTSSTDDDSDSNSTSSNGVKKLSNNNKHKKIASNSKSNCNKNGFNINMFTPGFLKNRVLHKAKAGELYLSKSLSESNQKVKPKLDMKESPPFFKTDSNLFQSNEDDGSWGFAAVAATKNNKSNIFSKPKDKNHKTSPSSTSSNRFIPTSPSSSKSSASLYLDDRHSIMDSNNKKDNLKGLYDGLSHFFSTNDYTRSRNNEFSQIETNNINKVILKETRSTYKDYEKSLQQKYKNRNESSKTENFNEANISKKNLSISKNDINNKFHSTSKFLSSEDDLTQQLSPSKLVQKAINSKKYENENINNKKILLFGNNNMEYSNYSGDMRNDKNCNNYTFDNNSETGFDLSPTKLNPTMSSSASSQCNDHGSHHQQQPPYINNQIIMGKK